MQPRVAGSFIVAAAVVIAAWTGSGAVVQGSQPALGRRASPPPARSSILAADPPAPPPATAKRKPLDAPTATAGAVTPLPPLQTPTGAATSPPPSTPAVGAPPAASATPAADPSGDPPLRKPVSTKAEYLKFTRHGKPLEAIARVLVEAEDGGLLAEDRSGRIWTIRPEDLRGRRPLAEPFTPLAQDELAKILPQEYPGYSVLQTRHYLIVYNTSAPYAQWCGGLLERLYQAFHTYWSLRRANLVEPEFPLVAVVCADQASFAAVGKEDLGEAVDSVIGFYSFRSNRVLMYDLTGLQAIRAITPKGRSATVQELLSQPQAERTVATVIHEATHQISFNCGLQTRFTDCPLWFSEGFAMFFETPDLSSKSGWRTIGAVNAFRCGQFQERLNDGAENLLLPLLRDDRRMRSAESVQDAYADAWALHYFLAKTRPDEYLTFLKRQSRKPQLVWAKPEERVQEFQLCFGDDLPKLEREWIQYFKRLRQK